MTLRHPLTLEQEIGLFCATYAPRGKGFDVFVERLRALMNKYARAAIDHGDVPEVGVPHKAKPKP